ncbi:hypothetical protein PC121_g15117 [Phytophthora cactorum]|nr:hypothetical protein PC121_g15117 [Phytophthora cactorum]
MSSQNEWNELEARYATPPAAEERSLRSRRRANRQRARLRLQQRQVRRRIEAQESAAVAAGEEPVLALTQAELAVLSRRYATPSTGEDPAARRRRLANRRRALRRLESRAAARRLDTDGRVAESGLQPPMDEMSTDDAQLQSRQVQDRSDALPANTARSTTSPYSHEQLAAAVLNISAVSPHPEGAQDGFSTHGKLTAALRNLSPHAPSQELVQNGSPTYAQLADALRNLTPDVPTQDSPSPGFPSYAQLNAALRNLSPDTPSQDTFAEGFPTYTQSIPLSKVHLPYQRRDMLHGPDSEVPLQVRLQGPGSCDGGLTDPTNRW